MDREDIVKKYKHLNKEQLKTVLLYVDTDREVLEELLKKC